MQWLETAVIAVSHESGTSDGMDWTLLMLARFTTASTASWQVVCGLREPSMAPAEKICLSSMALSMLFKRVARKCSHCGGKFSEQGSSLYREGHGYRREELEHQSH